MSCEIIAFKIYEICTWVPVYINIVVFSSSKDHQSDITCKEQDYTHTAYNV